MSAKRGKNKIPSEATETRKEELKTEAEKMSMAGQVNVLNGQSRRYVAAKRSGWAAEQDKRCRAEKQGIARYALNFIDRYVYEELEIQPTIYLDAGTTVNYVFQDLWGRLQRERSNAGDSNRKIDRAEHGWNGVTVLTSNLSVFFSWYAKRLGPRQVFEFLLSALGIDEPSKNLGTSLDALLDILAKDLNVLSKEMGASLRENGVEPAQCALVLSGGEADFSHRALWGDLPKTFIERYIPHVVIVGASGAIVDKDAAVCARGLTGERVVKHALLTRGEARMNPTVPYRLILFDFVKVLRPDTIPCASFRDLLQSVTQEVVFITSHPDQKKKEEIDKIVNRFRAITNEVVQPPREDIEGPHLSLVFVDKNGEPKRWVSTRGESDMPDVKEFYVTSVMTVAPPKSEV